MSERKLSIGAIVFGYAIFAGTLVVLYGLTIVVPRWVDTLPLSFFMAGIAAVVGGYAAGVSARGNETRHGLILGAFLALTTAASFSTGRRTTDWLTAAAVPTLGLCAGLGGLLRARQQARRALVARSR
jgi:hypothetical protein